MHIRLQTLACGVGLLAPEGELEVGTAPVLRARLFDALAFLDVIQPEPARVVVVDLSRVTFLDCSALSVLLEAAQMTQQQGGMMCLAGARGEVARILTMSGLDKLLNCSPGQEGNGHEARRARVARLLDAARERHGAATSGAPASLTLAEALCVAQDLFVLGDLTQPPSATWQAADAERALTAWHVRVDHGGP
ncbi:MAG TPA: STAS domain-containing protein [Marmoricola sp.]